MINNRRMDRIMDKRKVQKLTDMARLYYLRDMTQNEIAKQYGVSRPLISRMLQEAKNQGIVKIDICPPFDEAAIISERAGRLFRIGDVHPVINAESDAATNDRLADAAIEYLKELKQQKLGIGWGPMLGNIVARLEESDPADGLVGQVCPLVGSSELGGRNYHSNELVRAIAAQAHAESKYFYAPYAVKTENEYQTLKSLDGYREMKTVWEGLEVAIVNIGDYPSVPDFSTEDRFGDKLRTEKAVGCLLNYYFDEEGHIITSSRDFAFQIPIESLRKIPHVIGICSANTSPKALLGALRTGLLWHLVAPEIVLRQASDLAEKLDRRGRRAREE